MPCLGFDAELETSIPVGASLSSSAALEVAIGFAVCGLAGIEPDPVKIARLGQRVENEIVGIQSGIMDQLISATAVVGSALRIDCRDLSSVAVRIPDNSSVMIMDTMTRRELVDSEYDLRRSSCERARTDIGVPALRDATLADLDKVADPVDRARARHVITENARVLRAEDALSNGDVAAFGELMNESHESLRSDYAVSSEALDLISGLARNEDGCFGARMTGGGFAGCAVAILESSRAATIEANVASAYEAATGVRPDLVDRAPGSRRVDRSDGRSDEADHEPVVCSTSQGSETLGTGQRHVSTYSSRGEIHARNTGRRSSESK